MSRRPRVSRAPPSSNTSRTAVSGSGSPVSCLPLGSDQSSYFLRWTSSTCGSPPSAAGRQATAPAALISLLSGGLLAIYARVLGSSLEIRLPYSSPDQALLHITQRPPPSVPRVPGPVAVGVQPPGGCGVVHAEGDQLTHPSALGRVGDPD